MEIKLMVVTHKEGFGSIPYFSENLNEYYRSILEKVNYVDYPSNEDEMVEIKKDEYYIYFITYIGGNDEFGRVYNNIISTLFEFPLTDSEKYRLKNVLLDVQQDISENIDVFLTKSYFTSIKRRAQQTRTLKLSRQEKEELEKKHKEKEIIMLEEDEKRLETMEEELETDYVDENEKEIREREQRIKELQENYRKERIERKRMIRIKQRRVEREKEVESIIRRNMIYKKELHEVQEELERVSLATNLALTHIIKIFERIKLEADSSKRVPVVDQINRKSKLIRSKNPELMVMNNVGEEEDKKGNQRTLILFLIFLVIAFIILLYLNISELKKIM